jgi:hypothetical protein
MTRGVPGLEHVAVLSDDVGIIQHAVDSIPNRSTGYCTDDVARALIVALQRLQLDPYDAIALRLVPVYLAFLHDAQLPDGRFHNFMSYQRSWLDEVGTNDSVGRAIWSLGYATARAPKDAWRRHAGRLLERALSSIDWLEHPRASAYAVFGLAHAATESAAARLALSPLAESLHARLDASADDGWHWFEPHMTYDNARLPEALLRAGMVFRDRALIDGGLRSLEFLESVVFEGGIFVPIGNDGWYERGGRRARFAQQPLEAAAMTDAELAAFDVTGLSSHLRDAERANAWFEGGNSLGVAMTSGGGCYDGLEEGGPNLNMGAESTLAYLSSAYALAIARRLGKSASGGESIPDDHAGVRST